ncbi:TadE/TadG family type IV pilus assembly protein [Brevundimonas sp. G8]|uniref:TadE/TadG family type IV pilus assembly protein n=1 Tax=Brevundimonas sp. G8 TaxID=1350776 RepID=UPI0012EF91B3|nr:TadE/TadG family type IV pilus assembly protein [Brevundimonas sp. G8]VXC08984.1 Pilus assembly protein [Brevundimonas sp. G8]
MKKPGLMSRLRVLAHDTRGVAAVEFAFLAPILILFYFSMVEFCQGYMALKRTGHVASMVADLVSRTDAVTKQQVNEVLDIGDLIMTPFSTTTLQQRVSSVTRVNATTYRVDWSVGRGSNAMKAKLPVADAKIPSDLLAAGESVIVAEAVYDYVSPFDRVVPYGTKFVRMAYLRPRTIEVVACSNC